MANWLRQTPRLLNLDTPLGDNTLALIEFHGVESLSHLFQFSLEMISGKIDIDPQTLIGQPITVTLSSKQKSRYFHGLIHTLHAGEIIHGIRYYHAQILPWLSFLDYTSDCRIFQNKNVIDIAKLLFGEFGFSDFSISGLTQNYSPREYCVQYRETTLQFLHRLFEEEGIFYYFTHEKNKHTLILADNTAACPLCESHVTLNKGAPKAFGLTYWERRHQFYSGTHEQTDFNFEIADTSLHTKNLHSPKLKAAEKYGRYDYPGRYENTFHGKNYTQHHFESHEINYEQFNGAGNYHSFTAGHKINLLETPVVKEAGKYILYTLSHTAIDKTYLGTGESESQHYSNSFSCIPETVSIRIKQITPKPLICGIQTAKVVGPKGEEIYTDHHGRVKVQFHWDRKGQQNELSSCWVRVTQLWAGKNWGAVFIPRVGHEVVVHFLEGNPDRPLIIGSVYNSDTTLPYEYPFDATKSGIKSNTSKGGNDTQANEFYFEDKVGAEKIYLHAQKDFSQVTENNHAILVKNDEIRTINNSLTEIVKNNKVLLITQGNYSTTVKSGKTTLEAAQSIELKVQKTRLLITPDGIYIKAPTFEVDK